jgi:cytidylate kinase
MIHQPQSQITSAQLASPVSISGQSKCGKTKTVEKVLERLLELGFPEYRTLDCGALPRRWADEKGVSIEKYVAEMTAVDDRLIDDTAHAFMREDGPSIAAGRLTWWVAPRGALKIWLVCPDELCASRVEVDVAKVTNRNADDTRRYMSYYGLMFPPRFEEFDLVISTENNDPDTVASIIVGCMYSHASGRRYERFYLDREAVEIVECA